jgi:predicted DNA-binding ribbon-helix-helix protein
VSEIDRKREQGNLSSAIRLQVLYCPLSLIGIVL